MLLLRLVVMITITRFSQKVANGMKIISERKEMDLKQDADVSMTNRLTEESLFAIAAQVIHSYHALTMKMLVAISMKS